MKLRNLCLTTALVALSSHAFAAGENMNPLTTVADSTLGGYLSTMPVGWTQMFTFGAGAAPATSEAWKQTFFAFNSAVQASMGTYPTTVPPAVQITRIGKALSTSTTYTVLSKEALPTAAQVASADCKLPNYAANPPVYNVCPSLALTVTPLNAIPGRLLVTAMKQGYVTTSASFTVTQFNYVYDPSATLAADKWVLIASKTITASLTAPGVTSLLGLLGTYTPADTNVFVFPRPNATSTQIISVVAKP